MWLEQLIWGRTLLPSGWFVCPDGNNNTRGSEGPNNCAESSLSRSESWAEQNALGVNCSLDIFLFAEINTGGQLQQEEHGHPSLFADVAGAVIRFVVTHLSLWPGGIKVNQKHAVNDLMVSPRNFVLRSVVIEATRGSFPPTRQL